MDNETKNYLFSLLNPSLMYKGFSFYTKLIAGKKTTDNGPGAYYPENLKDLVNTLSRSDPPPSTIDFSLEDRYRYDMPDNPVNNTITLTGGPLAFGEKIDWQTEFTDVERTVSLHRWGWLLEKLIEEPSSKLGRWGIECMMDWLDKMEDRKDHIAWESYSTGERICNALLFITITGQQKSTPELLLKALADMSFYLADRLEYRAGGKSFNHVLNNARALYFAGVFLDRPQFKELAKEILRYELGRLINTDGFLREGSSHYQFLITRWILEVFWLASLSGDEELGRELKECLVEMLKSCWFFLVFDSKNSDWHIPLIGDVSPDFTPGWLIGVPWSNIAQELFQPELIKPKKKGWIDLFPPEKINSTLPEGNGVFANKSFQQHPESGWFRLDMGKVTLIWHIEPTGSPAKPGHGHCDTGAFSLYLAGEEVLVDPGRSSYVRDVMGNYGISASAHNSLTIDGLDPFIYRMRSRYPESYRTGKPVPGWGWEGSGFKFRIRHEGFRRIFGDSITFERKFEVSEDRLVIEDHIGGEKVHTVKSFFQWAPAVSVEDVANEYGTLSIRGLKSAPSVLFSISGVSKEGSNMGIETEQGVEGENPGGWYFPSYGRQEKTTTTVFNKKGGLPMKNRFTLTWEG